MPTNELPIGAGGFAQVDNFLTPEQVNEVVRKVKSLRKYWVKTDATGNFCLGLDYHKFTIDGMRHAYHAQASKYNSVLAENFPELIWKIESIGSFYLKGPNGMATASSRPRSQLWTSFGFLISDKSSVGFDADGDGKTGLQIGHFDYDGLDLYPEMLYDEATRGYTATICLETPADGGGLVIWPHRSLGNEFNAPSYANGMNGDKKFEALMKGKLEKPQHLTYTEGGLTLFDLFLPHAVDKLRYSPKKPLRIVMVVHFLYVNGQFEYWF